MQRLSSSLSSRTISAGLSAGLPAVKPAGRSDRRTKTVHSRRLARTENTARGNFGKQRNSVGKSRSGQSRMAEFFTGRNPQYEKRNRRYAHACRGRGCRQTRKIACRSYETRRTLRAAIRCHASQEQYETNASDFNVFVAKAVFGSCDYQSKNKSTRCPERQRALYYII